MRFSVDVFQTLPLCFALAIAHAGCTETYPEDFEVTSDVEQGLLARIVYQNGRVEFVESEDGDLTVATVFARDEPNPLRGVEVGKALPSELFTYLTGREPSLALVQAERRAALTSNLDAFGEASARADSAVLAGVTQSLTGTEFRNQWACESASLCATDVRGDRKFDMNVRTNGMTVHMNVLEGSLRVRIRRNRLIGGDVTAETASLSAQPDDVVEISSYWSGVPRKMWVVVDEADDALYHLSIRL